MIDIVKSSITDGQVADWVRKNVKKSAAEKAVFNNFILNRGTEPDPAAGCVAVSEAGAFGAATVVNPLIAMTLLDVYALQPTELHAATPK